MIVYRLMQTCRLLCLVIVSHLFFFRYHGKGLFLDRDLSMGDFIFHLKPWMFNSLWLNCRKCSITKTRLFNYKENFTSKKTVYFQIKNYDIFHISVQNIDCRYSLEPPHWGGSNEYPQSMFLSRNKKNNVLLCKPQFYYIKEGFKGIKML